VAQKVEPSLRFALPRASLPVGLIVGHGAAITSLPVAALIYLREGASGAVAVYLGIWVALALGITLWRGKVREDSSPVSALRAVRPLHVVVAIVALFGACGPYWVLEPLHGKVVDAESRGPVPAAIVGLGLYTEPADFFVVPESEAQWIPVEADGTFTIGSRSVRLWARSDVFQGLSAYAPGYRAKGVRVAIELGAGSLLPDRGFRTLSLARARTRLEAMREIESLNRSRDSPLDGLLARLREWPSRHPPAIVFHVAGSRLTAFDYFSRRGACLIRDDANDRTLRWDLASSQAVPFDEAPIWRPKVVAEKDGSQTIYCIGDQGALNPQLQQAPDGTVRFTTGRVRPFVLDEEIRACAAAERRMYLATDTGLRKYIFDWRREAHDNAPGGGGLLAVAVEEAAFHERTSAAVGSRDFIAVTIYPSYAVMALAGDEYVYRFALDGTPDAILSAE
jgi:hypothetical protein